MTKYNIRDKEPRHNHNRWQRRRCKMLNSLMGRPTLGTPALSLLAMVQRIYATNLWKLGDHKQPQVVFDTLHAGHIRMDQARTLLHLAGFTPAQFELYLRLS